MAKRLSGENRHVQEKSSAAIAGMSPHVVAVAVGEQWAGQSGNLGRERGIPVITYKRKNPECLEIAERSYFLYNANTGNPGNPAIGKTRPPIKK